MEWNDVRFRAQCTPFRHLAFFPDMAPQWTWMRDRLGAESQALNLFGYTGVGTLALSATGASLVHVDASKKSVEAGKRSVEHTSELQSLMRHSYAAFYLKKK